ncbi:MAG: hypothetical protein HKP58_05295 [Desulfatitalea sp.]|nr:hypothetical protein [Desulfatitalea sp.]NNJ99809.1 hypothetical protein [Desulfatitalea sp.]
MGGSKLACSKSVYPIDISLKMVSRRGPVATRHDQSVLKDVFFEQRM